MKRFILAAIVALVGLVSCEKELADAIVGTWEATSVEMTVEGVKLEIDVEEAGLEMSFTATALQALQKRLMANPSPNHSITMSRTECCI